MFYLFREVKKLSKYNEQLLKDYKEIHEKYAEIVGHQNHKQRIKHVSQLKDKINQLEQVRLIFYFGFAIILYWMWYSLTMSLRCY